MSPPRCRPSGPKTIIRLRRPSKNCGGIVHLCCPSKKPQLHHSPAPPRREARGTSGAGRRRRSPANDLRGPSTSRDGSSFICTVGSERPSTRAPADGSRDHLSPAPPQRKPRPRTRRGSTAPDAHESSAPPPQNQIAAFSRGHRQRRQPDDRRRPIYMREV